MKNTITTEIERESTKELSITELVQIEENLVQVVERFTERIKQKLNGASRKLILPSEKFRKTTKLFQDFKEKVCA